MTKETVKVAGRQLGKVCLIHPTIAFDYMLERVQSFQNLIGPVVESMRFLSELSFDILACMLWDYSCCIETIFRFFDRKFGVAVEARTQN